MRFSHVRKVLPILIVVAMAGGALSLTTCSSEDVDSKSAQTSQEQTLYTCSMHPNVVQDEPGDCPICGMDLVPIKGGVAGGSTAAPSADEKGKGEILYYQAPMDPNYISEKPGKSPMGMDLVPVYSNQVDNFGSTITVDPTVVQNMGVRTAPVRERNLTREISAVGNIVYDETKLAHVHTKVSGYIEKTHIQITGERVEKGEPLVEIYSPELVATQEEYLQAYKAMSKQGAASRDLLSSTRRRLEFWDITDQQIDRLETTGNVRKTMTLYSPFTGIVVFTNAIDGMRVQPGTPLYKIADLSTVWVEADIYEYELPWLEAGQPVEMHLSYTPGKMYKGRIDYIYPYLDKKTRTVRVRSVYSNQHMELKPGMYANLKLHSEIGTRVPAIPEEAVIWSGERTIVFTALGEGHFSPRDVKLGALSGDGYYEVLSGVRPGETVVTSGQFLLDSESKLKEALQKMLAKRKPSATATSQNDTSNSVESHNGMSNDDHSTGNMK